MDPAPELELAASLAVPHQVGGDMSQPGVNAAVSAKRIPAVVGLQQAVLHNRLGQVLVAGGISDEPEQAEPVDAIQRVDVVQLARDGFTRHAGDHIGIENKLHTKRRRVPFTPRLHLQKRLPDGRCAEFGGNF